MIVKLKKKRLFWIFVIGIFLIVFHFYGVLSPLENFIFKSTSSIRNKIYFSSKSINVFIFFNNYKKLKVENEFLKKKSIGFVIDTAYLKKIENENEVLKKELNYIEKNKIDFILAKVISGFYLENNNILVINRGLQDSVQKGMPVIFQEGIIVGSVINTNENSSEILLLSDKNSLITATIYGSDKINGIVKGDLDYGLEMNYIPIDTEVKEGDLVLSSGLEEKIPSGLIIGQVKEVLFERGDFFKTAIIYPTIDYQNINFVSVINKF